jgi:hypothetical protein
MCLRSAPASGALDPVPSPDPSGGSPVLAVLSNVHANLEALRADLADLTGHGAEAVYCVGDVVGYGPDPRLPRPGHGLARGAAGQPRRGRPARPRRLRPGRRAGRPLGPGAAGRRGAGPAGPGAAAGVPGRAAAPPRGGGLLFVHGSARDPLNEYVHPEDAYDHGKRGHLFALVGRCRFQGHTHVPGVFTAGGPAGPCRFRGPEELGGRYRLGRRKALVNVAPPPRSRPSRSQSTCGPRAARVQPGSWVSAQAGVYGLPDGSALDTPLPWS